MNTMQDYQEIIGDRRDTDLPRPQTSHHRLYQILAAIQIVCLLTITVCAMLAAGYFG